MFQGFSREIGCISKEKDPRRPYKSLDSLPYFDPKIAHSRELKCFSYSKVQEDRANFHNANWTLSPGPRGFVRSRRYCSSRGEQEKIRLQDLADNIQTTDKRVALPENLYIGDSLYALKTLARDLEDREANAENLYIGDGLYPVRTLARRELEDREANPENLYIGDSLYPVRTLARDLEGREAKPDDLYVGDGLYALRTLARDVQERAANAGNDYLLVRLVGRLEKQDETAQGPIMNMVLVRGTVKKLRARLKRNLIILSKLFVLLRHDVQYSALNSYAPICITSQPKYKSELRHQSSGRKEWAFQKKLEEALDSPSMVNTSWRARSGQLGCPEPTVTSQFHDRASPIAKSIPSPCASNVGVSL